MKRGKPLRRTPLARTGAGWSRTPAPVRHTTIAKVSKKRVRANREYTAAKAAFLAANPLCQRCKTAPATDLDHKTNRSQSPAAFLDEANWQALCRPCHDWKTTHPAEAVAEGFATPGWAYRKDPA